ncbi:HNH endonuclease [Actinocorallia lasiicapitis]
MRHAIRMLVRGVAVVEEALEGRSYGAFPEPRVLRLVRYVSMKWRHARKPGWSKPGVYKRDKGRCGYCGRPGNSIDHIVPVSRGGASSWENTILACTKCNHKKADHLLAECGMALLFTPLAPTWDQLMN